MHTPLRILLGLALVLSWGAWHPAASQASCEVHTTTPTYSDLTFLGVDLCDSSGNKMVSMGTAGGLGTATAAAPTRVEGAGTSFSFDLSGNARVTLGTLISGEDQTNNLMMVSGGVVRQTSMGAVTSATSSAVGLVPTGVHNFMAQMTNGSSETKAFTLTIYGNWTSSTTGGIPICTIYFPSTATITHAEDTCHNINEPYSYYYYTAAVYTSASSAPLTVYAMY